MTVADDAFVTILRLHEQEIVRRSFEVAKQLVTDPVITAAKFRFVQAVAAMSDLLKSRDDENHREGRAIADEILKGGDLTDDPAPPDTPPKT